MYVLAGDIGGTKALMGLAQFEQGQLNTHIERRLPSADYADIESLIEHFLELAHIHSSKLDAVVLAVAGPVQEQEGRITCKLTNLPWTADSQAISSSLNHVPVSIINDFAAIGYALPHLGTDDLEQLQAGQPVTDAPRLAVGAGTGLGVCLQDTHEEESQVYPSEGGHVAFAPANPEQLGLLQYWMEKNGHCSREFLLSGPGIARIGEYVEHGLGISSGDLPQESDRSAAISLAGLKGDNAYAEKTMQLFADIYASQLGDLALSYLPRGGLFVAGGIAPKILPLLRQPRFLEVFRDKPPMQAVLDQIPVNVVTTDRVGLIGALFRAAELAAWD